MTAPRHTSSRITPKGTRPKGSTPPAQRAGAHESDPDGVTPWHETSASRSARPGRTAPGRGPRRSGHRGGR